MEIAGLQTKYNEIMDVIFTLIENDDSGCK